MVSDTRTHRGAHPRDPELFNSRTEPTLRTATSELSWLLSRGYKLHSALKLVGDRHALVVRQREAISRSSCADVSLAGRTRRLRERIDGETLWVDGLNVLLTVEVGLGGGVVLLGRDGCARDVASVHGSYRRVEETLPALESLCTGLLQLGAHHVKVLLDEPVSNTRKLAAMIREVWGGRLDVEVDLVRNPDRELIESGGLVASADGMVLDECASWVNVARWVVAGIESAWVVDLG